MDKKPRRYCFSQSIRHAVTTMAIDWGWQQVGCRNGNPTFSDNEGFEVIPAADIVSFRDQRGAGIYIGYGATENRDWRQVWDMFDVGYLVRVQAPQRKDPADGK